MRVVRDCIAEPARAMNLAERIDGADDGIGIAVVGERVLQAADHGDAGNGGVDGEEDIVEDDKGVEGARFGDSPGLVTMLAVVPVDVGDGDEVDGGDGQWHLVGQGALVDVLGNGERVRKGGLARPWRRNRLGCRVRGELEDGA